MDLTVTGRHIQVSQQLRERLDDRLDKVAQLAPTIHRVDVVVTHERQARNSESVEVTCYGRGPVIRAEASADDKYAALDAAFDKLTERLRRAADRRRELQAADRHRAARDRRRSWGGGSGRGGDGAGRSR